MKLPGIIKLAYLNAYSLPDLTLPWIAEFSFSSSEFNWIELDDVASISEEVKSGYSGLEASVSLEFKSSEEIPINKPVAFFAVDASGRSWLVGNRPPHCGALTKNAQINLPSDKASVFYYSFSVPVPLFEFYV